MLLAMLTIGWRRAISAATRLLAGGALALAACRSAPPPAELPEMVVRAKMQSFSRTALHYELLGNGPPVVLVHPSATDMRIWDREVAALAPHFLVLRFDLPSHGRSRASAPGVGAHEELRALLDELRIPRAAIVGLSAGASIATDFALAYPDRVTRLVLASPSLGGYVPQERPEWLRALAAAARAGDADGAAELFASSPLMAVPGDTAAAARLRRIVLENTRAWTDTVPPRPLAPAAFGRMAQLAAPTLIVVGSEDATDVHLVADRILHGAPDARRVVLDGVGHMVNLAAPAAFDSAVVEFLRAP